MLRQLLAQWRNSAADKRLRQAHALFDQGKFAAAAAAYTAVAERAPAAAVLVNLGYCRAMLDDGAAATEAFGRALSLQPDFAPALVGLGDFAARRDDHEAALRYYDQAVAAEAGLAVAHNNRAQSLFALGRNTEAWRESEWRHTAPGAEALYPHRYGLPRWDGQPIAGRVLIHWEQGYGDILQHLRFLTLLGERGIDHVFECPPPLLRLVARSVAPGRLLAAREVPADTTGFAAVASLLSLPYLLGVDAEALPPPPYVRADAELGGALRRAWGGQGARLVGIAWRGSNFDPSRNASLQDFAALGGAALRSSLRPNLRIVSLQKGATAEEAAQLARMDAVDPSADLADFAATADIIGALDAVVAVDTAVAHLAGALARPLWLLLNQPAAVRWMLARADSPWYPSARLLRKPPAITWGALVERAARDIGAG